MTVKIAYRTCDTCVEYADVRRPVIVPAMAARVRDTGETSLQILDRYMAGVHDRHLAGLPVLPAPP